MSGQAPTNRFRGILGCTGKDGEQEASGEGEVFIPLFPNLERERFVFPYSPIFSILLAPSFLLEVTGDALLVVPSSWSGVL